MPSNNWVIQLIRAITVRLFWVNSSVFLDVFINNFEDVEKKFIDIAKKEIIKQDDYLAIINKSIPGKK